MSQNEEMLSTSVLPIVSIITPTYNRAHLLPRVWNSLQKQTLQAFQWIIVDDGSTDNTEEVVFSFKDPRICYIYQENAGVNAARSRGEREIKGEFVVFLDSDDELYAHDTLETMVNTIKRMPPGIGVVAFTTVDTNGKPCSYMEADEIEANYIDHVCEQKFRGEFFSISRREILSIAPWPSSYNGLEVLRHWRLAQHCKSLFVRLPARIYHRWEGDNLTSAPAAIRRAPSMAQGLMELIESHKPAWLAHCPCQLGRYLFYVAMYQTLAGQTLHAVKSAIAAWPTARWTTRCKIISLLLSLLLPTKARQYVFLWRTRIRDTLRAKGWKK